MLLDTVLKRILDKIPTMSVGVLGDLFLDRYLDLDAALKETSLETGLPAYQVVRVRPCPGAAGTVVNNLAALGVDRVLVVSAIGDDGEGYELMHALAGLRVVELDRVVRDPHRRTPTYTKPMLCKAGEAPRELNRLDIKNRTPLPGAAEAAVLKGLAEVWPQVNALLVLDQVGEAECGVVTSLVRHRLRELGRAQPNRLILADSRERIGLFESVWIKPNEAECKRAAAGSRAGSKTLEDCAQELARRADRPVFCTRGEDGMLIAEPDAGGCVEVPAYAVPEPIDVVGAGDSSSAALACALAAGAGLAEAASFGNLVASITIKQIGTTGTATPEQVRQRWEEVKAVDGR